MAYSVYFHSVLIERSTYLCYLLTCSVHFFHFPRIAIVDVKVLLFWPLSFSIGVFSSHFLLSQFFSHSSYLPSCNFHSVFSLIMSLSKGFQVRPCNDSVSPTKDCVLKIDVDVVLYGEQEDHLKVAAWVTVCGAAVTNPDEFPRCLHGVDLCRWFASILVVIKLVVIQKDGFPIPYLNEYQCTSMEDVPEIWRNVSKYGSYVWDRQSIEVISQKSNNSSSKTTSKQDRKNEEGQGAEQKEIKEVTVPDTVDALSVETVLLLMIISST